jgi:hypothetical protein
MIGIGFNMGIGGSGGLNISSIGSIITEDDVAFITEDDNYITQE